MTQRLRDTKYARELATAKLPTAPGPDAFAAIERILVKETDQVEIRFSSWQGSRLLPRALDLPEEELLALLEAALRGDVLSASFKEGLARLVAPQGRGSTAAATGAPATELEKVQAHFHDLIRGRAGDWLGDRASHLPQLSRATASEAEPGWFAVEGMAGGFKYWWDASTAGLRLMSESWSKAAAGSGQLHEVTPAGSRLLGEGFA